MKKLLSACLVLIAASACEGRVYAECSDPYFGEIQTEKRMDCEEIRKSTDLAVRLMEASGMWPRVRKFAPTSTLVVKDAIEWDSPGGKCSGFTSGYSVEVDRNMSSLLHEMFHLKDNLTLDAGLRSNWGHDQWKERGRYGLSDLYQFILANPPGRIGTAMPMPEDDLFCAKGEDLIPDDVKWNLVMAGFGPELGAFVNGRDDYARSIGCP